MSFDRVRPCWGWGTTLAALAAICLVPRATPRLEAQSVGRQPPPDSTESRARGRLFDSADPLQFTLTADFGAIVKQRGTEKTSQPGVLSYVAATGDSVVLDVQLRTRGHWRLAACQYPPLKVEFDREKTAHTLFAKQGSLKLTVQCRGGSSWANYLLEEYLIYRAYNLLTERSFRARLARVTYVDARGKHPAETRHAFFVEDDDRMARRNDLKVFPQKGVYQNELNFDQTGLTMVFQYMIGNTDFAVSALHNIVLIRDSAGVVYPVPYDFDWSGVIWTPYAQPDVRLPIRTVRQRIFRGTCRAPEELTVLFGRFNAQKDAMYALYHGLESEGLEPNRVKQALDYYDQFFKIINDPGDTRREFIRTCKDN
ncbi:MAG: hypothetical protein DMD50_01610 [Gemmatimonadetes bacterium]|nr:MAG: hypothetical protein DMD50_01610 [Gemmatimonadota bacterium]